MFEFAGTRKQESRPNLMGISNAAKKNFDSAPRLSFDDVRIHYNSDRSVQLQALAYTQENQACIGSGREGIQKKEDTAYNGVIQRCGGGGTKTIYPLDEEGFYTGNLQTDEIVYPNLDSCLGITVAVDRDQCIAGGHLVMTFGDSEELFEKIVHIINTLHQEANKDGGFVHIAAGDRTDSDVSNHIDALTIAGSVLKREDKANIAIAQLRQLLEKSKANTERWEHQRFERTARDAIPDKYHQYIGTKPSLDVATYKERAVAPERGCCYITTACVDSMGLPDNCDELTTLRNFRDTYLISKNNGRELIDLYYSNAPQIVASIRKRLDKKLIFKELFGIIANCVNAIKAGDNEYAFQTYCDMVLKLKKEYG